MTGTIADLDVSGTTGIAYLSAGNSLYTLNLGTGVATLVGAFGTSGVLDVAVIPEPSTYALLGLTSVAAIVWGRRRRGSALAV